MRANIIEISAGNAKATITHVPHGIILSIEDTQSDRTYSEVLQLSDFARQLDFSLSGE